MKEGHLLEFDELDKTSLAPSRAKKEESTFKETSMARFANLTRRSKAFRVMSILSCAPAQRETQFQMSRDALTRRKVANCCEASSAEVVPSRFSPLEIGEFANGIPIVSKISLAAAPPSTRSTTTGARGSIHRSDEFSENSRTISNSLRGT